MLNNPLAASLCFQHRLPISIIFDDKEAVMPDIHNDNYSIILHAREPRVLFLLEENGWTLPRHQATDAEKINTAMEDQLRVKTTVLYCAYDRYKDDEREEQHLVYVLENHSPDWIPAEGQHWVSLAELQDLQLIVPEHMAVIETVLASREQGEMYEQRPTWAHVGWFATAEQWIQQQLDKHGYVATDSVKQLSVSTWSTVLCIPTTMGDLYFKASVPVFAYEPLLTQTLAMLVPAHIPPVLAVDNERHWMLMQDAGKTLATINETNPDPTRWEEALRLFAQMQIDLVAHVGALEKTGCPDMRLHVLPALFEEALAAKDMLLIGQKDGMPEAEYEQLLAFVPELKAICVKLAEYNVPESLHHDDFHGNNILYNGKTYVFFDWAECALAHPFYSLMIVQRVVKYVLEYDDAVFDRFRDAYLAPWTYYEPIEHLREAFTLAVRLGKLCRALTWQRFIAQLEPSAKWQYEGSFPYFLRVFLGTEE